MSPLPFVGIPDWRSAILALAFTLPWLLLLAGGWLRRPRPWVVLAVAAILFPLSILFIQVPIQQLLNVFWLSVLPVPTIERYVVLVGLPSIVVSGLVQESVKLAIAIGGLRLLGGTKGRAQDGLALGAAAGAGYGGFEAFWIFNTIFAAGWTLASVQLGGPAALLGFFERFVTVPFHVGAAALAGYGYATGRPWRFWLLAVGLHSLTNWSVLFLQARLVGALEMEGFVALIAAATIGGALYLRFRPQPAVAGQAS